MSDEKYKLSKSHVDWNHHSIAGNPKAALIWHIPYSIEKTFHNQRITGNPAILFLATSTFASTQICKLNTISGSIHSSNKYPIAESFFGEFKEYERKNSTTFFATISHNEQ